MTNTIVFITDNTLDEEIASLCRRILVREAKSLPIISVSQKPVELGTNICVGDIGRNWISLYKQLLTGVEAALTDWIVVAEHDVIYSHQHLSYSPDDASVFHYNHNAWLVQWPGTGPNPIFWNMYSYWPKRLALSQLICHKGLLKECLEERLYILEHGGKFDRLFLGCGEPGVVSERALEKARKAAASGKPIQLQRYLKEYLRKYAHKVFGTDIPNLDIRHTSNYSGPKRGKQRRYELTYWNRFEDVMVGQR